jgi:hypothetical protein
VLSPDFEQCADGEVTDHAGFVAHVRARCSLVVEGRKEGLSALRVGERAADRRRVMVTESDDSTSQIDVYLVGTLDSDGRLCRVVGVTRVTDGDAGDAVLARARCRQAQMLLPSGTRLASLRLSEVGPRRGSSSGDTHSPSLSCRGGAPTEKETTA